VADVIGRFAPTNAPPKPTRKDKPKKKDKPLDEPEELPEVAPPPEPTGAGLRGEYFQSKGMSKADKLGLYRVDARLAFDFGEASPSENVPGADITADQFTIIWRGGLIINDTGHHEFRVSTENGARLYLNLDPQQRMRKLRDDSSSAGQQALIDAWVSSGEMREHTARVFLLGGRIYPLRLEFFKYLEKTASIKLEWKPPHGTWSVLDHNHTTTVRPARVHVCETPFPADDRSLGYERGSSVSREWHAATTYAAIAAAAEVVQRLPLLADFTAKTEDRDQHVKDFVLEFARVAFRCPLTSREEVALAEVALVDAPNLEAGVRRAVVMALMSPHFLYTDLTPVGEAPSPYTIASRLSFGLWDSIPDQQLRDAASDRQLETTEQLEAQASRMLADPRAKAKMRSFFQNWLELEERDLAKDKQMFPEFDEAVIADLRRSLELFIERVVWSPESDYRQLLLADYLLLNERPRRLYLFPDGDGESEESRGGIGQKAISAPSARFASAFKRTDFPADRRSGVLTHPYLLSAFAYHNNTSPIHRGVLSRCRGAALMSEVSDKSGGASGCPAISAGGSGCVRVSTVSLGDSFVEARSTFAAFVSVTKTSSNDDGISRLSTTSAETPRRS
jgi:hypothetical protein